MSLKRLWAANWSNRLLPINTRLDCSSRVFYFTDMTPSEHARKFYKADWEDMLAFYVERHYVYASPTSLCLAKPEGDHWWIEFLAGDMSEVLTKLPFWLPEIRFNRRGKPRSYWMADLVNKLLPSSDVSVKGCGNDSVEDGFTDPPARWWWRRREVQTTTTASTYNRSGEPRQVENPGQAA